MAKLIVTSTTNSILVSMNDYFTGGITQEKEGVWRKDNISFKIHESFIIVSILGEKEWMVSNVEDLSNGVLQIDSVGGTGSISDVDSLYNLLKALLA